MSNQNGERAAGPPDDEPLDDGPPDDDRRRVLGYAALAALAGSGGRDRRAAPGENGEGRTRTTCCPTSSRC